MTQRFVFCAESAHPDSLCLSLPNAVGHRADGHFLYVSPSLITCTANSLFLTPPAHAFIPSVTPAQAGVQTSLAYVYSHSCSSAGYVFSLSSSASHEHPSFCFCSGILLFALGERKLMPVPINYDCITFGKIPCQYLLRQWILDPLLDRPLQRPRSERRIITFRS